MRACAHRGPSLFHRPVSLSPLLRGERQRCLARVDVVRRDLITPVCLKVSGRLLDGPKIDLHQGQAIKATLKGNNPLMQVNMAELADPSG